MKILLTLSFNRMQIFTNGPFSEPDIFIHCLRHRELRILSHYQHFSEKPRNFQGRMSSLLGHFSENLTGRQSSPGGVRSLSSGVCSWVQTWIHDWAAVWPWRGYVTSVVVIDAAHRWSVTLSAWHPEDWTPWLLCGWIVACDKFWPKNCEQMCYMNLWNITLSSQCEIFQKSLLSLWQVTINIQDSGCSISLGPRIATVTRVALLTCNKLELVKWERNKLGCTKWLRFRGLFVTTT